MNRVRREKVFAILLLVSGSFTWAKAKLFSNSMATTITATNTIRI